MSELGRHSRGTFITLDGNKLLRDLRLPHCTIALLRNMKIGDKYDLFDVSHAPMTQTDRKYWPSASARVERVRGGYDLSALWMLEIGNMKRLGTIFVPGFRLKLAQGRVFEAHVNGEDGADLLRSSLRLYILIVRLAQRLSGMASARGEHACARMLRPMVTMHDEDRNGYTVPFLNGLVHAEANHSG